VQISVGLILVLSLPAVCWQGFLLLECWYQYECWWRCVKDVHNLFCFVLFSFMRVLQ